MAGLGQRGRFCHQFKMSQNLLSESRRTALQTLLAAAETTSIVEQWLHEAGQCHASHSWSFLLSPRNHLAATVKKKKKKIPLHVPPNPYTKATRPTTKACVSHQRVWQLSPFPKPHSLPSSPRHYPWIPYTPPEAPLGACQRGQNFPFALPPRLQSHLHYMLVAHYTNQLVGI